METPNQLENNLSKEQLGLFTSLDTPIKIQAFLDEIPYSAEDANRCPLRVLRDRQAHCLDGGLLAVAALRRLGYPPVIIDMLPEPGLDDDHVLAIFKHNGRYGALAKSNFVGLRYREPVYLNLRELVMSYFEVFFNVNGVKTMRSYSRPLNLASCDRWEWEIRDSGADLIEKRLYTLRRNPVISDAMFKELAKVDKRSYDAGTLGTDSAGLYKPRL